MSQQAMAATIKEIAVKGKGILAADESTSTIAKRLQTIQVEPTEENRRMYREILFTTPHLGDYVSGVILYEETLKQATQDNKPFAEILRQQKIVPGIKVDAGTIALSSSPEEKITQGLDNLGARLVAYKELGARFAKWRAVLSITDHFPSCNAVRANAEALARYASICQSEGIVPIVEPELLMDGDHTIERCFVATEKVLHHVFKALYDNKVVLENIILKPSMVIAGNTCKQQGSVEQVAEMTLKVLKRTVPAAVPTINFLSGGQSDELATAHLNAMNQLGPNPWLLSFSYGRALQAAALKAWSGVIQNKAKAQQALAKRARLNSIASLGQYRDEMEVS